MSVEIEKGYPYPKLTVIRSPDNLPVFIKINEAVPVKKRKRKRKKKETPDTPFKDWCMPEQEGRYIRGNEYDFF